MIHPSFWTDPDVRKLSLQERLLFLGCISMADDEGRLLGTPEYLKAQLFPYDPRISAEKVKKWRDNIAKNLKNFLLYDDSGVEYIQFLKWSYHQKPSHPKPSKLPLPNCPESSQLRKFHESITESFTESSSEGSKEAVRESITERFTPSLVQSSQGKNSIDQDNPPPLSPRLSELNFKDKSDNDLTDYLTTMLQENMPRGVAWGAEVIMQFWKQCIGESNPEVLLGARTTVKSCPPRIVAQALVKARNYGAGKHHAWKYVEKIIDEELRKQNKEPGRGAE
jgi:hypothetical protein